MKVAKFQFMLLLIVALTPQSCDASLLGKLFAFFSRLLGINMAGDEDLVDLEPIGCSEALPNNTCLAVLSPVVCGGELCSYTNPCLAQAAGYNVDFECVADEPFGLNEVVECPEMGLESVCHMQYDPVMCGDPKVCEYSNDCVAEAAGYNVTADCKPSNLDAN